MPRLEIDDSLQWLQTLDRFQHKHQCYEITDLGRAALRDYEGLFHEHLFLREVIDPDNDR